MQFCISWQSDTKVADSFCFAVPTIMRLQFQPAPRNLGTFVCLPLLFFCCSVSSITIGILFIICFLLVVCFYCRIQITPLQMIHDVLHKISIDRLTFIVIHNYVIHFNQYSDQPKIITIHTASINSCPISRH